MFVYSAMHKKKSIFNNFQVLLVFTVFVSSTVHSDSDSLSLGEAVSHAVSHDPWLTRSEFTERSLLAQSDVAEYLPDPKITVGASNFPTDTFDFNQEPMTQLNLGISQMFPRGDSRRLRSKIKAQVADQQPHLRANRQAKTQLIVTQLWLEGFRSQQSTRLINADRSLFEQMVDFAEISYSSASGMARQQDVIRAQLELTQLEDRLTKLQQKQALSRQALFEWLPVELVSKPFTKELPQIQQSLDTLSIQASEIKSILLKHPALIAFDQSIQAADTEIELARQKYKPEWGLSAKYGYRGHDLTGNERADFISLGIVFDMPIFSRSRQDSEVKAAASKAQGSRLDKELLYRQMLASFQTNLAQLEYLDERQKIYQSMLLPQMQEQSQASLTAYNNDDGDFAEAIRAQIAELNAKIEYLNITVDRQKQIAQLNYMLAGQQPIDLIHALQD